MSSLAIRITKCYSDLCGVVQRIAEVSDKLVVYEHDDGARLHCHALVIGLRKSVDTVRRWLRSEFVNPARSDISLKESYSDASGQEVPINDDFIVYMSKGRYSPKYVKGYTDTDISGFCGRWVDYPRKQGLRTVNGKIVVDGVGDGPSQPSTQRGQKTKWQLLEEMQVEWGSADAPEFDSLFKIVRRVLVANKQAIGFYKVMDYMEAFLYVHKKDTARAMLKQMWNKKFSCY